jgi:hypothetical protein
MRDGKTFIAPQYGTECSAVPQIKAVLNWFTELQQRVHVK